jgi:hypothetical protein
MGKKVIIIIFFVILTLVCAIWSPWQYWDISIAQLVGVEDPPEFARLQVSSLAGEIEIFIDDESQGTVGPEGSPFIIEDVKPGKRLLKLERVSENQDAYIKFERLIEFFNEVDVVIAYELGPNEDFSEGSFISAFKNVVNRDSTKLNIYTEPSEVRINLDGRYIGESPIEGVDLDLAGVHELKLDKKGYEPQTISLLPEDEENRSKLKGFDINVEANLFLIPIRIE